MRSGAPTTVHRTAAGSSGTDVRRAVCCLRIGQTGRDPGRLRRDAWPARPPGAHLPGIGPRPEAPSPARPDSRRPLRHKGSHAPSQAPRRAPAGRPGSRGCHLSVRARAAARSRRRGPRLVNPIFGSTAEARPARSSSSVRRAPSTPRNTPQSTAGIPCPLRGKGFLPAGAPAGRLRSHRTRQLRGMADAPLSAMHGQSIRGRGRDASATKPDLRGRPGARVSTERK